MTVDRPLDKTEYIKGELLYTIFQNQEEGFSIVKVKIAETNTDYKEKEIVVKGYLSSLQEGVTYYFSGEFEKHPRFGIQYRVSTFKTMIPNTKDGLISYLSSDLFYGIGEKTATKVVDKLGESAISTILNNPEVLSTIPGLKKETADTLLKGLQENQGFEQVVIYLSTYQIGLKMAQNIYQTYKEKAIEVLEKDPYQYVFDIEGFGFQTADRIAKQLGLSLTHPNRIGAGCVYVLQNSIQDGHVYLPVENCIQQVIDLLWNPECILEDEEILNILVELNKEKKVILQDGFVYLPSLYYAEDGFASHIKRLLANPVKDEIPLAELMKIIGDIEEEESLSYGKEQFEAINRSLHSKLMILTGGPGTGKTTVIKGIIKTYATIHDISTDPNDYDSNGEFPFILTAPTGRAAKRMNESTGLPAVTIHRLLGWNGHEGFEKNEQDQLAGRFLIVDEFSMVDIWLANHLFKAIPDDMQVLIVGDEDQLPSVGPGQVLTDLLDLSFIPTTSLHEVYRQKEGSKIIEMAHHIKNDTLDSNDLQNDKDFSFINCSEHQIINVVTQVLNKAMEKGIDAKDVQILAPIYRSEAGITEINKAIQQLVNPKTPKKREVKTVDTVFRVGDKVLQLVNQPEDGVFNGDIGEIVAIFEEDENTEHVEQLVVAFDEKEVVYERKEYINITLAYCISIHKSQGSEFPNVLLPIVSVYRRMLRKNLIYTAITRSKQSLIICGEKNAFFRAVKTLDTNKRYTSLRSLLKQRMDKMEDNETERDQGDKALSPYDFM